ncbi:MAG: hypothetical protein DRO15_05390 [Thermoprotei archaeon]|nr:MAG: hypothetical protein DRO15_05390 [Thermoprotei archaeon]
MEKRCIAVIGLDGLSFTYLNKLMDNGVIPYMKHYIYNSSIKRNLYAFPPVTPQSWTSIMTGVNIGKHGIYGFIMYDDQHNPKVFNAEMLGHPRIHEMLSLIGKKSIVINPIPTYPLYPIRKALQFSFDFFTPKPSYTPSRAKKYFRIMQSLFKDLSKTPEESLEIAKIHVELYLQLIEELINKEDYDLFWINLRYPDSMIHMLKDPHILSSKIFKEEMEIFRNIDRIFKTLAENSLNTVIVSDHGFSIYKYVININSYLYRNGFITLRDEAQTSDEIHGSLKKYKDIKTISWKKSVVRILRSPYLRFLGRFLKNIHNRISKKPIVIRFPVVDRRKSKAFAGTFYSFNVFVNDYNVVDSVITSLKNLPGIRGVYRKEQLFWGPYLSRLPDIYVEPWFDKGYYVFNTREIDPQNAPILSRKILPHHHPLGVFIMKKWSYGELPDPIPNYLVTNLIMIDLGVPISSEADGIMILRRALGKKPLVTSKYLTKWGIVMKLRKSLRKMK